MGASPRWRLRAGRRRARPASARARRARRARCERRCGPVTPALQARAAIGRAASTGRWREEAGRRPRTASWSEGTRATAPASSPRGPAGAQRAARGAPGALRRVRLGRRRARGSPPGARRSPRRLRRVPSEWGAQGSPVGMFERKRLGHGFLCLPLWGMEWLRGCRRPRGVEAARPAGRGAAARVGGIAIRPRARPSATSCSSSRADAPEEGVERLLPFRDGAHRRLPDGRPVGRRRDLGQAADEGSAGLGRDDGPLDPLDVAALEERLEDRRARRGRADAVGLGEDLLDVRACGQTSPRRTSRR